MKFFGSTGFGQRCTCDDKPIYFKASVIVDGWMLMPIYETNISTFVMPFFLLQLENLFQYREKSQRC